MMTVTGGAVDVTTYFVLRLAATGVEATGLTITDFDLQYTRSGVAPTAKVDATALAATDSAHGDNQAIEIDATDQPGLYRVDWPDAAFAAGVKEVILTVKCATVFTEHLRVMIDAPVNATKIGGGTVPSGAVPNAVAGAAGGLFIAGSNAATTTASLTTGAIAATTITASGAVAFQSTFAVTTSTALAALSASTVTFSGAVAFQSTFAVTTSTSLAALSATTVTFSGAVAFQSTFIVTGAVTFSSTFATTGTTTFNAFTVTNATTLSGAVSLGSTLTVTGTTTLAALAMTTLTASGAVAFQSTFAVTTSTALAALSATTVTFSGAVAFQSTFTVTTSTSLAALSATTFATSGTTTFNAFTVTNATTLSGAVSLGSTLGVTGTTTLAALNTGAIGTGNVTITGTLSTSGTATFNAFTVTNATTLTGAVSLGSTLAVTGTTTLAALAMTTLTASGAVAFQSTFAVTTSTSLAALSATTVTFSGAVAFQSTFAVTTSTSLAALSATTITASGTTSLAAVTTSGTVTFSAFTVTGALTAGSNAVPWNAAWDAEVQSEAEDALVAKFIDKLVTVSGTADSGSTTTMVDAARTEGDNDYWKGSLILFTSGVISGQCRIITDFVAATDTFTFTPPLTQTVGTETYAILPSISVWDDTLAEHLISGTTGSALNAAGSAGDPWATALPGVYGAGTAGRLVGRSLPDIVAGGAGGLVIAGSNAATTFAGLTTGALAATTITASGAVAFQSTFAVTTSTSLAALSATTITASGTTSLAAVTTSGTVTFNAFTVSNALTVSGATTLTGIVTASNASNNIVGITVAAIGNNVITAASTAADYVTEIQSGLATSTAVDDLPTNAELATALGTADDATLAAIAALVIPTAAANADAVWDEVLSGHVGAGSAGEALAAAGTAGDPWTTALPGAYGAGTAGKIVGDNLNATVGSRATQTSVDDLPTNAELATALGTADDAVLAQVALVKAKTDQLTFTVANQVDSNALSGGGGLDAAGVRAAIGMASANLDAQLSLITGGVAGAGAIEFTVTINNDMANPLDGAEVWVSTDEAGSNVVAGTLNTDAMGQATFLLDAGSYFLWIAHSGYNRDNPTAITVTA